MTAQPEQPEPEQPEQPQPAPPHTLWMMAGGEVTLLPVDLAVSYTHLTLPTIYSV